MTNQDKNQNPPANFTDEENILNKELEKELEIHEDREFDKPPLDKTSVDREEETIKKEIRENDQDNKEAENYIKAQLLKIKTQINQLLSYLDGADIPSQKLEEGVTLSQGKKLKTAEEEEGQKIVEGVFTGEEMIGPDGKRYSIPSNYASKSKLIEGDILKLVIKQDGTFVYKQIGPVERKRLIGTLIKNDATDQFYVMVDGERWRILKASVTFFKGEVGDETIILVPADAKSKWAAVENIVKKAQ